MKKIISCVCKGTPYYAYEGKITLSYNNGVITISSDSYDSILENIELRNFMLENRIQSALINDEREQITEYGAARMRAQAYHIALLEIEKDLILSYGKRKGVSESDYMAYLTDLESNPKLYFVKFPNGINY